jgi:hypothetical protein
MVEQMKAGIEELSMGNFTRSADVKGEVELKSGNFHGVIAESCMFPSSAL